MKEVAAELMSYSAAGQKGRQFTGYCLNCREREVFVWHLERHYSTAQILQNKTIEHYIFFLPR